MFFHSGLTGNRAAQPALAAAHVPLNSSVTTRSSSLTRLSAPTRNGPVSDPEIRFGKQELGSAGGDNVNFSLTGLQFMCLFFFFFINCVYIFMFILFIRLYFQGRHSIRLMCYFSSL